MTFSKIDSETSNSIFCSITFTRTISEYMNISLFILQKTVLPILIQSFYRYFPTVFFSFLIRLCILWIIANSLASVIWSLYGWTNAFLFNLFLYFTFLFVIRDCLFINIMVKFSAFTNNKIDSFVISAELPEYRWCEPFYLSLTLWPNILKKTNIL